MLVSFSGGVVCRHRLFVEFDPVRDLSPSRFSCELRLRDPSRSLQLHLLPIMTICPPEYLGSAKKDIPFVPFNFFNRSCV